MEVRSSRLVNVSKLSVSILLKAMSVSLLGKVMEVRAKLFMKAFLPIFNVPAASGSLNVTEARLKQFANASLSITVTLAGMTILVMLLPANAEEGITSTPSGMV